MLSKTRYERAKSGAFQAFRKGALPIVTLITDALFHTKGEGGQCRQTDTGGITLVENPDYAGTSATTAHSRTEMTTALQAICSKVIGVSVDGKAVSTIAVSATTWTDYSVPIGTAAGTHTVSIAFTNDLYASKAKDRNLRIDKVTLVAAAVPTQTPAYFPAADWLNKPIAANAATAANSATWVGYLSAPGQQHIADQLGTATIVSLQLKIMDFVQYLGAQVLFQHVAGTC